MVPSPSRGEGRGGDYFAGPLLGRQGFGFLNRNSVFKLRSEHGNRVAEPVVAAVDRRAGCHDFNHREAGVLNAQGYYFVKRVGVIGCTPGDKARACGNGEPADVEAWLDIAIAGG